MSVPASSRGTRTESVSLSSRGPCPRDPPHAAMPPRSCGQCENCLLRKKCLRVPRAIPAQGADRPPRALRRAASAPPSKPSVEVAQEEDCGGCAACLDKPKFGGQGRIKKRCQGRMPSAPQPSASSDQLLFATSAPAIRADCGACANCADMAKFGGPGKRRKGCARKGVSGSRAPAPVGSDSREAEEEAAAAEEAEGVHQGGDFGADGCGGSHDEDQAIIISVWLLITHWCPSAAAPLCCSPAACLPARTAPACTALRVGTHPRALSASRPQPSSRCPAGARAPFSRWAGASAAERMSRRG